ncbi:MAG: MBL fold metallo-hydrolase [bacterium JZ-2024 1]
MSAVRVVSLSSGSCGNSLLVQYDGFSFLLDAGLSLKATSTALKSAGASLDMLNAILVTHEHRDHIAGISEIVEERPVPVYCAAPVRSILSASLADRTLILPFLPNRPFRLGPWEALPVPVPHDAVAPVGFFLKTRDFRLAHFVDIGRVTARILHEMSASDVVVLESNHDIEMLTLGSYPEFLKRRIRSGKGHISNDEAGEALAVVFRERRAFPPAVFLAHLSDNNNTPQKALETVRHCLLRRGILFPPSLDYAPRGTVRLLAGS